MRRTNFGLGDSRSTQNQVKTMAKHRQMLKLSMEDAAPKLQNAAWHVTCLSLNMEDENPTCRNAPWKIACPSKQQPTLAQILIIHRPRPRRASGR